MIIDKTHKRPITITNKTHYFNPEISKTQTTFSSPSSYQSRYIKIEGYETRLYWQFKYCEENNGQTFFYTLTYNDKSMPKYLGKNCFDYEDLRQLLNGGFKKQLLRKWGTNFKYFCGAELGDGKGERGMHNNPHYHILFFLENAHNELFPYKMIQPEEFRHLVKLYWQGFDEYTDGPRPYETARYGIAKEGENCGKVIDFRACQYVAKYVCKDVELKKREYGIKKELTKKYTTKYKNDIEFYKDFYYNFLKYKYVEGEEYELDYKDTVMAIVKDMGYEDILQNEYSRYIEKKVNESIKEYRNRYCNKCRISQGVGDYALKFVNKLNPTIQVPSKTGFKNRPINMYYYRKLFTNVVKDAKGQNIRILNADGIKYKSNKLHIQLIRKQEETKNNLKALTENGESLFNMMRESDINTSVQYNYDDFIEELHKYNIQTIIKRYAEYKLVYEDRFFKVKKDRTNELNYYPGIDINGDYQRFLIPSYYCTNFDNDNAYSFLKRSDKDYMAYDSHPYFLQYNRLFGVLDMCSNYWFIQDDNKKQKEAEDIAEIKRFHNKMKVKKFYKNFN